MGNGVAVRSLGPKEVWRLLQRSWAVGFTRLRWRWRLGALGHGAIIEQPLAIRNPRAVAIGSRVTILRGSLFADLQPGNGLYPKITVGDGTIIAYRFQCNCALRVSIGENVGIASGVFITDSDHVVEPGGVPITRSQKFVTRPVEVQANCWIGQNAVILKGVTVGHDSIIGANSVVTRDVPPCSVAVGNPARVIKRLAQQEWR